MCSPAPPYCFQSFEHINCDTMNMPCFRGTPCRLAGECDHRCPVCWPPARVHLPRARPVLGHRRIPGLGDNVVQAPYCAAKHGVAGFTKSTALEVATKGITVNCICPGYVWTELIERQVCVAHSCCSCCLWSAATTLPQESAVTTWLVCRKLLFAAAVGCISGITRHNRGAAYLGCAPETTTNWQVCVCG
jgi:hypothetical protein